MREVLCGCVRARMHACGTQGKGWLLQLSGLPRVTLIVASLQQLLLLPGMPPVTLNETLQLKPWHAAHVTLNVAHT